MLGVLTSNATKEAPVSEQYAGKQIVGMDLHRRRSVLVRMTEAGEHLETVRISNDPEYLRQVMARAVEHPEVVSAGGGPWFGIDCHPLRRTVSTGEPGGAVRSGDAALPLMG